MLSAYAKVAYKIRITFIIGTFYGLDYTVYLWNGQNLKWKFSSVSKGWISKKHGLT